MLAETGSQRWGCLARDGRAAGPPRSWGLWTRAEGKEGVAVVLTTVLIQIAINRPIVFRGLFGGVPGRKEGAATPAAGSAETSSSPRLRAGPVPVLRAEPASCCVLVPGDDTGPCHCWDPRAVSAVPPERPRLDPRPRLEGDPRSGCPKSGLSIRLFSVVGISPGGWGGLLGWAWGGDSRCSGGRLWWGRAQSKPGVGVPA